MLPYSVLGLNLRTEETPFTKRLRQVLAVVLFLQFIVAILRVVTITDTTGVFIETWMLYLGYVVYSERSPCMLIVFVSLSFVRGVLTLLAMIEWLKKNLVLFNANKMSIIILIVYLATPIISFLTCSISYNIFKNLQVVEDVEDQLNQLLNPWNNLNIVSNVNTGEVVNEAAEGSSNTVQRGSNLNIANNSNINNNMASRVIYAPFTGRSYKLSDVSSINSIVDQKSNPIYKGT